MPELPEIESLRRQLSRVLKGENIGKAEVYDRKIGRLPDLQGRTVAAVRREGKALWVDLGGDLALRLHMRMSGRLLWRAGGGARPAHTRFCLFFRTGELLCVDPRRFATLEARRTEEDTAAAPDALQVKDAAWLQKAAQGRRLPVKTFLMDQRILTGIGNIYACEILYDAAVDPHRAARSVSRREWRRITDLGLARSARREGGISESPAGL
ncbi:MAG: Formamidopyrimidine-DNA glycosylase [Syntrophaceae bacterium PtaU1.Bin231]|nr:MAG: Formamidopyrimidine-DNA glycosylase [Syntrophaceae bacterium PtaU1.Bin231]